MRKVFLAVFAASLIFAASASAHVSATPACGSSAPGSLVLNWYDWSATGNGDGGLNQPTWQIVFTPAGGGASTTTTGQVTFSGATYSEPEPLPAGAGTYIVSYAATENQDRNRESVSGSSSGVVTLCPSIITTASSTVTLGGSISDTATLAGGSNPTGTITFNAYSASDKTCSNSLYSSTANVSGGDGQYTSGTFTPASAGSYQWVASYSGDSSGNPPATDACNTTGESVVVTPVTPSISTTASAGITLGGAIGDTADLTGGANPTGTITFNVYSANDTTCSNSLAHGSVTVSGNGAYKSATYVPSSAGSYQWVASYSGDGNNAAVSDACNSPAESVVVGKVTPAITTTASAGVTLGSSIGDTATLSGGTNPTGTITFNVYSASDTSCSTSLGHSTATVTGNGAYKSATFTPTAAGSYQWVASYSGDGNNVGVSDTCNLPAESTVVGKVTPAITTNAGAGGLLGSAVSDTAMLSSGVAPTGTITFNLYSASDTSCSNSLFSTTTTVSGDGPYSSATYTPSAAGSYQWVASYSGDANNIAVSDSCNAPAESVVIAKTGPRITTTASAGVTLGGAIGDTADLAGATNATGTITFTAYSASDTGCATALFTTTDTVSGNGDYQSATFKPTAAGSYQWVASYSGDSNNIAATDACNSPAESVIVGPVTPSISTKASAGVTLGGSIGDTADLTGGTLPTGTITFNAYSASDTSCSNSLFTTTDTVSGDSSYVSATFVPKTAGSYQWIASYSGDSNNIAVSDDCNTPAESVVVGPVTPAISTTASTGVALGGQIGDTADLTGGIAPTGTITFNAYSASDTSCSTPLFTTTTAVAGNGNYASKTFVPTAAGSYQWIATYSGDGNNVTVSDDCNTPAESVVVGKNTPAISTTASAGVALGGAIGDTADLTGGTAPTGTITFNAYSASDTSCSTSLFSTTATVSGNGNYTSATFTPTTAGSYQWVASYSGDSNNIATSDDCNLPAESVVVGKSTPAISTTASAGVTLGTPIGDTADLTGGSAPTGTITFTAYSSIDTACATPLFTSTVKVTGNGSYVSATFTPATAGSYQWIASYGGDTNNVPVTDDCNTPAESVVVGKTTPAITTTASGTTTLGNGIGDTATLSGGTAPTGSITFNVYSASDTSCSNSLFTQTVSVSGNGAYQSPSYTPGADGSYQWVASYSGDANNIAVSDSCNTPAESVAVTSSPAFTVTKLETIAGSSVAPSAGPIDADVNQQIAYTILVANTGNVPVTITSFSDPHCDANTIVGPLNSASTTIPVGGSDTYACTHVVVKADGTSYTNTVTVTVTPPDGPALPPESSSVVANIPQQAVQAFCQAAVTLHGPTGGVTSTFTARVSAQGLKSVTFYLDGKKIKTVTTLTDGKFELKINPAKLSYGAHQLKIVATPSGSGCTADQRALEFVHAKPAVVTPKFTG